MKVTVEPTDIATIKEWTMKITGKHESKPEWIATIKAETTESKELPTTRWSVTIYTNTKGIATRKWTRGEEDNRDPAYSTAMGKLSSARELLKEKARQQAEYMATWEEDASNTAFLDNQDKDQRIQQKTDEITISLRYIDDE